MQPDPTDGARDHYRTDSKCMLTDGLIPTQVPGIVPLVPVSAMPRCLAAIDPSRTGRDHGETWPLADTPDVPDRVIPGQESGISRSFGRSAPPGVLCIE